MRKIPTLFVRDADDMSRVTTEVHRDCGWVLAGEGVATRKYDGTCVMLDADGAWWARREVKPGKVFPDGFQLIDHDPVTGKHVGWEPVAQSGFAKFHAEALESLADFGALIRQPLPPGTFELVGPKINRNPEGLDAHRLVRHAAVTFGFVPGLEHVATADVYDTLRDTVLFLAEDGWEGIVWHHPDGRMAKLKARDFGASPTVQLTTT